MQIFHAGYYPVDSILMKLTNIHVYAPIFKAKEVSKRHPVIRKISSML